MRNQELFDFIHERWSIHEIRSSGLPKPWTEDPILQQFRFCNVYREYDTETKWFAKNWRKENQKDPDLWFAALVFRLTNWHLTAMDLGYPVPWKPKKFVNVLQLRKAAGVRVFNPAYIVSTNGVAQEKCIYLSERLTEAYEENTRYQIRFNLKEEDSLEAMHERLMCISGVGSFIAAQVIADIKYAGDAMKAPDWWTFAASGPGSRRGLNRVFGFQTKNSWKGNDWYNHLIHLKRYIDPMLKEDGMPKMHAQDLQNCLCEFDKYERIRLGEGRPKQRYNGEG